MNTRPFSSAARMTGFILLIVLSVVGLAACGSSGGGGNAIPTPQPGVDVGQEPAGRAGETVEETWEAYLRDSIAFQVARQQDKLVLVERYQNPDHTAQNLGGLVEDIDLVTDRTAFQLNSSGTFATSTADFDVRITYANGDTQTRTCSYTVQIELDSEDGVWYVINPAALDVFSFCG
ncbi:MAG: hypothetical protein Kow00124_32680 [Anaerolineae bacterium]